ncbi:MAG: MinD/ParA family protein [Anaerolineae bacterium]|nr:MinD/ParA family protein [Anaerolineae bacterium]
MIIPIHSFRGGTGKSNTTANLTTLLAVEGKRVGVIDTDIQSPGIHVLFGLDETKIVHSLNDYLRGECEIQDTAHDVTDSLGAYIPGKIFLIPSSIKAGEIVRFLQEGYDVGVLHEGFRKLIERLELDVLMIDTHPGLNEETLLSIVLADAIGLILRPDQQDYQGTAVTLEVARQLGVERILLIVNKVPPVFDPEAVRKLVEETYQCEVAAVLPHSDDMMALASSGIFALHFPNHPVTLGLKELADKLVG